MSSGNPSRKRLSGAQYKKRRLEREEIGKKQAGSLAKFLNQGPMEDSSQKFQSADMNENSPPHPSTSSLAVKSISNTSNI